ncbi:MAG: hypothetical protein ABI316_00105 [Casimicrobiaceae bacterium]
MRLGRAIRYGWAAPASLVGIAVMLAAGAAAARARIVEGTIEVGGGGIAHAMRWLPRRCRFAAITLGHVIIGVDHETLVAVRRHEQVHVRQYERWGALFFPLYLGSSVVQLVLRRDPYHDNRFEREACERSGGR